MPSSDVSRHLDQPAKQYTGARIEQGRPLLDADFNEEARLRDSEQQKALVALVGPVGSPNEGLSPGQPLPLSGTVEQTAPLLEGGNLPVQSVVLGSSQRWVHAVSIRAGSLYLGGKRYALESPEHVSMQRGYLQMRGSDVPFLDPVASPSPSPSPSPSSPGSPSPVSPSSPAPDVFPPFSNFYYVRAWEQDVSAVEDEEIREVALAGADATTRVRRMHRVEILGNLPPGINDCRTAFQELVRRQEITRCVFNPDNNELVSQGRLQLTFQEEDRGDCAPCEMSPTARYLGHENVTLRLMLTSSFTYVWATDNAAPLYRVKVMGLSSPGQGKVTVKLLTPPKDAEHSPRSGRVVEILPFGAILDGAEKLGRQDPHFQKIADQVGAFARAKSTYDPATQSFELEMGGGISEMVQFVTRWDSRHPAAHQLNHFDPEGSDGRFFFMRLWHEASSPDEVHLSTASRLPLGDTGIVPVFHEAGRGGDYWTASFRVDTPKRCIPFDLLTKAGGVPPQGPRQYIAPLFFLAGEDKFADVVEDCRTRMRRASTQSCATRSVGDNVVSFGEYSSIQAAIDALPADGGIVEVRPGVHRGPVVVNGRRNVSLVGCGQSIIQTAEGSVATAIISLVNCNGFSMSGFTVQAVGQAALLVSGGQGLQLRECVLEAGTFSGGLFIPGNGSSDATLLELSQCSKPRLRHLLVEAGRQSALRLSGVTQALIADFEFLSDSTSSTAPAGSLVSIEQSTSVRLEEGHISAVAQHGVQVTGSGEVIVRNVVLESGPHQLSDGSISAFTESALFTQGAERLDIQQCRLSMDHSPTENAALSLHGRDLLVEECVVETVAHSSGLYLAWGGIHVRGGSYGAVLRHNHVTGGLGHGITLGSVLFDSGTSSHGPGHDMIDWGGPDPSQPGDPDMAFPRVHGDLRAFSPGEVLVEEPVERVSIVGNTIENMGTNGLSTLTVLGTPADQDFITIRYLTVSDNNIHGNARQPFAGMASDSTLLPVGSNYERRTELAINLLPRGGVILSVVEGGGDFRGNDITANSPPSSFELGGAKVALCGVFIAIGDSLHISDNRIAGNGEVLQASGGIPTGMERGVRAGIAILLAGAAAEETSPGHVRSEGDIDAIFADGRGLDSTGRALLLTRNSVRHPEGRALHLVGSGAMAIESNFLSSQGNHKGDGPVERGMIGDVLFIMDLGRPWEMQPNESGAFDFGPQVQNEDSYNFFVDYIQGAGASPRQVLGFGGALSFCNNQITYDWDPPGMNSPIEPLSHFASAIVSLDHVSVSGNQFGMHLQSPSWEYGSLAAGFGLYVSELLLSDVFVYGATVEVAQNRIAERVGNTFLSLASVAELSTVVAYNQCTHPLESYRNRQDPGDQDPTQRKLFVRLSNHVMYGNSNFDAYENSEQLKIAIRAFGQVMRA